jgi:hypothetical protein
VNADNPTREHSQIKIRTMRLDDLPFADTLRASAGWNQTPADWQRLLQCEPNGCFVAEYAGELAGTATTTIYSAGQPVFWDVLDSNLAASKMALDFGFQLQRTLVRMCRGPCELEPNHTLQFAIADPATG